MTSASSNVHKTNVHKTIHVAVAVIYYQDQFLLGYRSAKQHQGERFEFVGGKVDTDETPHQALIREVSEETGMDIRQNYALKLGNIEHDYGDKSVCLHVYQISLSAEQFAKYHRKTLGLENQPLIWATKPELLAKKFPLPEANITILSWLSLPTQLVITLPLSEFSHDPDPAQSWLDYHNNALPKHAWGYLRPKAELAGKDLALSLALAEQLLIKRPDIQAVLPLSIAQSLRKHCKLNAQIIAGHLSQSELLAYDVNEDHNRFNLSDFNLPLIVSCHDKTSIQAANQLAKLRVSQLLPPVMAILLAPVLPTKSHPDQPALGWEDWSELAKLADVPVIALGGVAPNDLAEAQSFGAISVAGIRQFLEKVN